MAKDEETAEIANFLFEVGNLKRVKRSGWWLAQIKDPESVAEHTHRCSVVALIIAKMEEMSDEECHKICAAAAMHDLHETRILDLNKVSARYIEITEEKTLEIEKEQREKMPQKVKKLFEKLLQLSEKEKTILKDADYLECAIQAKEYLDIGYTDTQEWIDSVQKRLKTKSAKKILEEIKKGKANKWFENLKKFRD